METVSVSELSRRTARVLRRVRAGESLEVRESGRPIARITPVVRVVSAAPSTGVPLLDRLIAEGRATPATMPGPISPTPPRDERDQRLGPGALSG
jgi:prevent-host-death family protein